MEFYFQSAVDQYSFSSFRPRAVDLNIRDVTGQTVGVYYLRSDARYVSGLQLRVCLFCFNILYVTVFAGDTYVRIF